MNVGELKAILDDFGDHLPVVILVDDDSGSSIEDGDILPYSIGSQYIDGEISVTLLAGKYDDE